MKRHHKKRRRVLILVLSTVVTLCACAALIATGLIWPNRIAAAAFPVRGVDVSSYQGTIDWTTLAEQDIDFAFIKATEGSGAQDERFRTNWTDALDTSLVVGSYHFMSFDSPGEDQAANIIATVPRIAGTLPPVIDLECYADYCAQRPSSERVREILIPLLAALEKHYGAPPFIYATQEYYDAFLTDAYPDNPVWIRSVAVTPSLPDGRDWTLWQYSHRDSLEGYEGAEHFIDMNVFSGSLAELKDLTVT